MDKCVALDGVDDIDAKALTMALNHVHGEDDPVLQAELLRDLFAHLPKEEIAAVFPTSLTGLYLAGEGSVRSMANMLQLWEGKRHLRLRHFNTHLTDEQLRVVIAALEPFITDKPEDYPSNPNVHGTAVYRLCLDYLQLKESTND